jgi:hypothetical protein
LHVDRLISALVKYWKMDLTPEYYWKKMDVPMTQNAVITAQFPENIEKWIWEKQYSAFEVY